MGIGKKIQETMKLRGLKQADLARAVEAPKTTISSIINNDNSRIDIGLFLRICRVLQCSPEYFSEDNLDVDFPTPFPLTSDEECLISNYRTLEKKNKQKVQDYTTDLAELEWAKKQQDVASPSARDA